MCKSGTKLVDALEKGAVVEDDAFSFEPGHLIEIV